MSIGGVRFLVEQADQQMMTADTGARFERPSSAVAARVFVVIPTRPKANTGVHVHAESFVRYAGQAGIDARLVSPFDTSPLIVYPFFGFGRAIKPFTKRGWLAWHRYSHYTSLRLRLERLVPRSSSSVVYAQSPIAALAALHLRDRGYPIDVVMIAHFNVSEADEWAFRGYVQKGDSLHRAMRTLEHEVLARVDRLIFPSQYVAQAWALDVRRRRGQTWHIPNFVFEPSEAVKSQWAGDLITIGTLEPRKNHQFLMKVLAAALQRGRAYRLTVVGDGELLRELKSLAASLGVADHVTFAGFVPRADSLIQSHRMYVHAATVENCPLVLLEAMAAGKPICAPHVGGIPEIFSEGVEGHFWNLDDPAMGAERLISVLEDPVRYRDLASAARLRYVSAFAPQVVGPRLLEAVVGAAVG